MADKVADYGQAQIAAFKAGAASGTIKFDPDVVDELIRLYSSVISGLTEERQRISVATRASSGGFGSAQQLIAGFATKAAEYDKLLAQFQAGALQMQEAIYIAGGRISDAEHAHAQALNAVAETLGATESKK